MSENGSEMPQSHVIQLGCLIILAVILILDASLALTMNTLTVIAAYIDSIYGTTTIIPIVPWWILLIIAGIFILIGLPLMLRSHKALFGNAFKKEHEPDHLITDGVFEQVRHPMYVGTLLIYLAFVILTTSLWGLFVLIAIALIYNFTLMRYEEDMLQKAYGDKYREYKETTRKWEVG